MKKLLVILFIGMFAGFVSAQCSEYVHLAEERLAPPYPNYFGAAGEYLHAAECYEAEGSVQLTNTYYEKAAQHYVIAAGLLVEGGDYFQKAKSYELAAGSFYKIGDKDSALKNYQKAEDIYRTNGFPDEANVMTGLITDKFGEGKQGGTDWMLMASVFVVIIAATLFIFWRRGQPKSEDTESKDDEESGPRVDEEFEREKVREPPIVYTDIGKEEEGPTQPTPKEKLAKKLREKYTPKY